MPSSRDIVSSRSDEGPKGSSRTNHLLAIGIDTYQHLPKLYNCKKDTEALITVLTSVYEFDPEHVYTLFDQEATAKAIRRKLIQVTEKLTDRDNLIIFFAGHGYYSKRKVGYLVPVDAEDSADMINNSVLRDYIRACEAHHIFLIVDSCFSGDLVDLGRETGSSVKESIEKYAGKVDVFKSRWGLAAGLLEKVSDGLIGDHSPFAEALIYYLKTQTADFFAAQELISHVSRVTTYNSDQIPTGRPLKVAGDMGGQFVFRRKVKETSRLSPSPELPSQEKESPNIDFSGFGTSSSPWGNSILRYSEKEAKAIANNIVSQLVKVEQGPFQFNNRRTFLSTFFISRYPVTNHQWMAIANSPNSPKSNTLESTYRDLDYISKVGPRDCPVTNISWEHCLRFIEKLKELTGLQFRLPTLEEWQYAARGGSQSKDYPYAGGSHISKVAWWKNNSEGQPQDIGQKKPNELGLYDMSGNVWEWCEDKKKSLNVLTNTSKDQQFICGGSWDSSSKECRIANWESVNSYERKNTIGIRLAATAKPPEKKFQLDRRLIVEPIKNIRA